MTIRIELRLRVGIREVRESHRHIRARTVKALEDLVRSGKPTVGALVIGAGDVPLGEVDCLFADLRGPPPAGPERGRSSPD